MGEFAASGRIDLTGQVILIVEEQPIVALNIQIAAEEAGGEAIIARGPNEALAQLHEFMVSAAVIDPQQRLEVRAAAAEDPLCVQGRHHR